MKTAPYTESVFCSYDAVYYGTLDRQEKNKAAAADANSKLARISQMRRIYLPKKRKSALDVLCVCIEILATS